jgi:hypothetical protein
MFIFVTGQELWDARVEPLTKKFYQGEFSMVSGEWNFYIFLCFEFWFYYLYAHLICIYIDFKKDQSSFYNFKLYHTISQRHVLTTSKRNPPPLSRDPLWDRGAARSHSLLLPRRDHGDPTSSFFLPWSRRQSSYSHELIGLRLLCATLLFLPSGTVRRPPISRDRGGDTTASPSRQPPTSSTTVVDESLPTITSTPNAVTTTDVNPLPATIFFQLWVAPASPTGLPSSPTRNMTPNHRGDDAWKKEENLVGRGHGLQNRWKPLGFHGKPQNRSYSVLKNDQVFSKNQS